MRLSRWGRSPYETNEDMILESEALGALVEIVPEGTDLDEFVVGWLACSRLANRVEILGVRRA